MLLEGPSRVEGTPFARSAMPPHGRFQGMIAHFRHEIEAASTNIRTGRYRRPSACGDPRQTGRGGK